MPPAPVTLDEIGNKPGDSSTGILLLYVQLGQHKVPINLQLARLNQKGEHSALTNQKQMWELRHPQLDPYEHLSEQISASLISIALSKIRRPNKSIISPLL